MTALFVILLFVAFRYAVSVKESWGVTMTVKETLDPLTIPLADTSDNSITHTGLNKSETNDANSVAGKNVTAMAQGSLVLVAGAKTLNLAAAPGTAGNVDFTGLKIRRMVIRAKATNANPITISFGAANPYTGFGAAFSLTLNPGKCCLLEGDATVVAAGVRTLDIAGTGTQGIDFIATAGAN